VGGLTAQFISTYERDDLAQAAEDLKDLWLDIAEIEPEKTADFLFAWYFKSSLYNPDELLELVESTFKSRRVK